MTLSVLGLFVAVSFRGGGKGGLEREGDSRGFYAAWERVLLLRMVLYLSLALAVSTRMFTNYKENFSARDASSLRCFGLSGATAVVSQRRKETTNL